MLKGETLAVPLWPETGQALGLSKNTTYEAAKKGEIPTVRFGRCIKVPFWFYKQMLEGAPKPEEKA